MRKFNSHKYNDAQIWESFLCPVNRHCTRVEHNCDDWELFKHPEWLVEHYIKNGGAEAFAKHREEKEYWIEEFNNVEKTQDETSPQSLG